MDVLTDLAGDRPLVLTVEDLHWADRSTVDFLHHLAQNAREAWILVVATVRTRALVTARRGRWPRRHCVECQRPDDQGRTEGWPPRWSARADTRGWSALPASTGDISAVSASRTSGCSPATPPAVTSPSK